MIRNTHLYVPYNVSASEVANDTVARPVMTSMSGDRQHSEAMIAGTLATFKLDFNLSVNEASLALIILYFFVCIVTLLIS